MENKKQGYLKMKKLLEDIVEAITNKSVKEIDALLEQKLKQKDMTEFNSKKELINNLTEGRNKNALHFAAAKGDPQVMQYLLEQGGDLMSVDEEGNTLLMIAVQHNHKEMVSFLINHK